MLCPLNRNENVHITCQAVFSTAAQGHRLRHPSIEEAGGSLPGQGHPSSHALCGRTGRWLAAPPLPTAAPSPGCLADLAPCPPVGQIWLSEACAVVPALCSDKGKGPGDSWAGTEECPLQQPWVPLLCCQVPGLPSHVARVELP